MAERHRNVERVVAAAAEHGLTIEVRTFAEGTRTADDAARAIGCELGQIVKSLAFVLDEAPVLALVSGANRLDEARLAAALDGSGVRRADPDTVRATTGFPVGGVPPLGHRTPMPTAVDEDLLAHEVVWAAAGTPTHVFAVGPDDLVRITRGIVGRLRVD